MAETGEWILWECQHLESKRTNAITRTRDFEWFPLDDAKDVKPGRCHHCRKRFHNMETIETKEE